MSIDDVTRELLQAASDGDESRVRELVRRGADVNAGWGFRSWTPLHRAAYEGHDDVVMTLVAAGAKLDPRDDEGCTPLYWAAARGHLEVARILVAAGADVNAADSEGITPYGYARARGHDAVASFLEERGGHS